MYFLGIKKYSFVLQGALYAAMGVAQGMGPLVFSAVFSFSTQKEHFFPEAPMLCLAAVVAVGIGIACTLVVPPQSVCSLTDDEEKDVLVEPNGSAVRRSSNRSSIDSGRRDNLGGDVTSDTCLLDSCHIAR
jgi:hypothetical protein